jgi:hypothetical protein
MLSAENKTFTVSVISRSSRASVVYQAVFVLQVKYPPCWFWLPCNYLATLPVLNLTAVTARYLPLMLLFIYNCLQLVTVTVWWPCGYIVYTIGCSWLYVEHICKAQDSEQFEEVPNVMVADLRHGVFSLLCLENAKMWKHEWSTSSLRVFAFSRRKSENTTEWRQYDT